MDKAQDPQVPRNRCVALPYSGPRARFVSSTDLHLFGKPCLSRSIPATEFPFLQTSNGVVPGLNTLPDRNVCNRDSFVRPSSSVQAQASKTREVVAQQRVLVQLEERSKASAAPIAAAKARRDKVQGFLKVLLCAGLCVCACALSRLRARAVRGECILPRDLLRCFLCCILAFSGCVYCLPLHPAAVVLSSVYVLPPHLGIDINIAANVDKFLCNFRS